MEGEGRDVGRGEGHRERAGRADERKVGTKERREGRMLIRQISSECVHCVGFWWPKNHNFVQFWIFAGLLY